MQNIWIWLVVAVVVIGGIVWWAQSSQPATTETPTTTVEQGAGSPAPGSESTGAEQGTNAGVNVAGSVTVGTPTTVTVTYDGTTFTPATVTIKKGDSVTFTSTAGDMWVATGPHPAHTGYSNTSLAQHCPDVSGTAFDQCKAGTSYTFTFEKAGTWPYHNHLNSKVFGKVVVTE